MLLTIAPGLPEAPHASPVLAYAIFITVILALLAFDLGVFHRKSHVISFKEALGWTCAWVSLALVFNVLVYFLYENHAFGLGLAVPVLGEPGVTQVVGGWEAAKTFLAGYIVEETLSMDNVFVMAVIFASLGIPAAYQHRVLFWGIMGAIIMRGAAIAVGSALVTSFAWITYVFGGMLVLTAVKMALIPAGEIDPAVHPAVRLLKRVMPVSDRIDGQHFFTRIDGRRAATPLLVALLLIEVTDVIFAVDSIPAIFAITADPFIVFTSNIMAILGLRSLYFCLAAAIKRFHHLQRALVAVLFFVGVKMCLVHTPLKIPTDLSIAVIFIILGIGVVTSLTSTPPDDKADEH